LKVLLGTTHSWCKWHVLCKVKERLGALCSTEGLFKVESHKIVNQMLKNEEFEEAWRRVWVTYSHMHPKCYYM
jgi:hypothetical protein